MDIIDRKQHVLILMPVFNDWESLRLLLGKLNAVLGCADVSVKVLAIDDASTRPLKISELTATALEFIDEISVLELTRNLGHQRAIVLGLTYVNFNEECDAVILMDADGEDSPKDVLRLIEKCRETEFEKLVFARRMKRSESHSFKAFYFIYRLLYRILTGNEIRVGNFSIVPFQILPRLVCVSEVWNHYSVGLIKSKLPNTEILVDRSKRLAGKSKMNFVSLVAHGLSAISVYGDVVGIRLLILTLLLILAALVGVVATVFVRLMTDLAIPGWATNLTAILLVIALQASVLSVFFVFIILSSRNNVSFLPVKDYLPYILRVRSIYKNK